MFMFAHGPDASRRDRTLASNYRFEMLDEDARPLIASYGFSLMLACVWLTMVYTWAPTPPPTILPNADHRGGLVDLPIPLDPLPLDRTPLGGAINRLRAAAAVGEMTANAIRTSAANAFASASPGSSAADISSLVRGVDVSVARPVTVGAGSLTAGKTTMDGGTEARTPGRNDVGAGVAAASRIGGVGATGSGVTHTTVSVAAPIAAPIRGVAPARASEDVGTFVRARVAQLQSCYERAGRTVNPNLAGAVTISLAVAGSGSVTSAEITRRTWSGAGSAEAEGCILSVVRGWRFPTATEAMGSYSIPMSFTH